MRIFEVGGCVRDRMMGVEPKDIDYVVTGTTETEFLEARPMGRTFKKVGADFPVFLDDQGCEWALARVERKNGSGYNGFEVVSNQDVTLEDDLSRRDLTINAMAQEVVNGVLSDTVIDPFNGIADLTHRIFQHVSPAFQEDPVRVLRVARLRARFGKGWMVSHHTSAMMREMARKGDLRELTAERVWKEMSRALMEPHPRLFFDTLMEGDLLHHLFPEVYQLKSALENRQWHPEGDAYEHTMLVLTQAAQAGFSLETRMAALCHDFGKALTPRDKMPKHFGHAHAGVAVAERFCKRWGVPSKMRERVMKATEYHMHMHLLAEMGNSSFVRMFHGIDAFRDSRMAELMYELGHCDDRGRLGYENANTSYLDVFLVAFGAANSVKFAHVFPDGCKDAEKVINGMRHARIKAVAKVRGVHRDDD